jgi:hypothetical protein
MRKAIIALILILVGLGSVCTIGTRSRFGCIECGLRRRDRTVFGGSMSADTPTPRSDWYDRRIDLAHDHRWTRLSCTRRFNIRGMTTLWTCGPPDAYPDDDASVVGILARLEPLDLDIPLYRELTHPESDRRMAAAAAAGRFNPARKKQDVLWCWEESGWPWPARR